MEILTFCIIFYILVSIVVSCFPFVLSFLSWFLYMENDNSANSRFFQFIFNLHFSPILNTRRRRRRTNGCVFSYTTNTNTALNVAAVLVHNLNVINGHHKKNPMSASIGNRFSLSRNTLEERKHDLRGAYNYFHQWPFLFSYIC